ncbi:hypothetical protein HOLleu_34851 [Holothuria leucospilota]|uniref:Uncharacterized protein n=1 Tax=Holothuria leucospilota TaxID=206669 RepID=A0A9Q1BGI9_HOLLE|nr:hypothetical protein HOLleu_34851 [Holothuria leucospilota]
MDEKSKVSRIVRKKLEGYFNREIIEREFDPSGAGLHTTTPLVARLEIAYMTTVDKPFRNVHKSPSKKRFTNKIQEESYSRGKDLIPQTQRDTKLKGRAQTKDVLRLARSSEDALNKISVLDVINVHRYRCQGVPYEHVSKGKVPHVSHHVHAYLNSEEALRYSHEWDDRKLAKEYKAKCNANRKNKPRRNQSNIGTAKYSPRSNTWIDFRNLPLTPPSRDDEYSCNPVRNKEKKKPTNNLDGLMTSQSTAPTDTDSQTSSVRIHYVRKDTGTLPEDGVYPSSSARISESQSPEKNSGHFQEEIGSDVSGGASQSKVADVPFHLETHPEHNTEERYSDIKESTTSSNSKSQKSASLSLSSSGEEKSIHSSQTDSPHSNEQDVSRLVKEQASPDEAGIGTESKTSHSLSPSSISGRERKRPKTAQQSRSTFRSSADDVKSFHSENECSGLLSGRINNDSATPSGLSSVPDVEITTGADQRFGGSVISIGDASSLLDELSIKSLSLQDTFSGSYSLEFEDDNDDDGSSEFDNVSYNSRSRGRSQNGGISLPNEESLRSTAMSVSPSNQSNRTEEYIRTESVVSLR